MKNYRFLSKMAAAAVLTGLIVLFPLSLAGSDKEITVAAVGDCIISHKVSNSKDARFLKLAGILRQADVTYANCETTFLNPAAGYPSYKVTDPNLFCDPWGADEFKWLGIDIVSLANNHTMDFCFEGLFSTLKNLERVGIGFAGAGKDLDHAAKPGYVDTAAGPVSLISCSSWIPEKSFQASLAHPHMNGRPGLNPLNTEWFIKVSETNFKKLLEVRDSVYLDMGIPLSEEEKKEDKPLDFGGRMKFLKGDKTEFILKHNDRDMERILEAVKVGRRNSRIVMVSIHEHIGTDKQTSPTEFQKEFARKCIDAGADLFFGTGPHQLWGIEIYKGKPIFYSLGNFFFQETRLISAEAYERFGLPAYTKDPLLLAEKMGDYFKNNVYWESFVPVITFDGQDKLTGITLYPIILGQEEPLYRRGVPRLATKEKAKSILSRLQKFSQAHNTKIVIEKETAKVVLK